MGALESVQRRRLSLEEFHRMGSAGVLGEDDRVELIDGDMIEMAPIGAQHLAMVNRLSRMLTLAAAKEAIVSA
jgi:Uma2 family endonuclease